MHDLNNAEKYWRQSLRILPWDFQDLYPVTMDRICQVMVAGGRIKEAEDWCNKEIKEADSSNRTLIADFKSIKARVISSLESRKKEALALLEQSLAVYDSTEQGRSSKIAMGAGKDFYVLANELGKPALAEKDLEKTKRGILNFEAPEGGAVWNALNLSYFLEEKNRISDAILLRQRAIDLANKNQRGTREISNWEADIKRLEAQLSKAAGGKIEPTPATH